MGISVDYKEVGSLVKKIQGRYTFAVGRGVIRGAMRGKATLQRATPKDTGQARASWRLHRSRMTTGARTLKNGGQIKLANWTNDAPHISILEFGARPHRVNPEGWHNIYRWVELHKRSFGLQPGKQVAPGTWNGPDANINRVTQAIVEKIAREGAKPRYFVRDSIPELRRYMEEEVKRSIAEESAKLRKAGGK